MGDIDKNKILDNGNSYHVVTTANVVEATVVDGFYITETEMVVTSTPMLRVADGVMMVPVQEINRIPRIFNCVFSNNYGIGRRIS